MWRDGCSKGPLMEVLGGTLSVFPPSPTCYGTPTRCHGSHIWGAFLSCSKASGVYLKQLRPREREHLSLVLGFKTWLPLDCPDCQFKNISISLLPLCHLLHGVLLPEDSKCGGFFGLLALMDIERVGYPNGCDGWMDWVGGNLSSSFPILFLSSALSPFIHTGA